VEPAPLEIHRRVLVTGGSGFIGTNVVEGFVGAGAEVLNVDIATPMQPAHRSLWRQIDIVDRDGLEATFRSFRPDVVIHLAARADLQPRRSLDWYAANIEGVTNVIDAIRSVGTVERSLFASTRLIFDLGYEPRHERDYHASTLYGQSKAKGEELVRNAGPDLGTWAILRPTGIWGPWFGAPYRDFFRTIARGFYVHPGRRPVRKAYGYVENTVYQIGRLASASPERVHGRTFWLADYPPLVVRDWARTIQRELGAGPIPTLPATLLRLGGVVGDLLERAGLHGVPLTRFRVGNMLTDMLYDAGPLETLVGPLPYNMQQGVQRTVAWLRREGHIEP
jgi:GlcNAc-P-P-Und epimerase